MRRGDQEGEIEKNTKIGIVKERSRIYRQGHQEGENREDIKNETLRRGE